jgi:hypothetical protein
MKNDQVAAAILFGFTFVIVSKIAQFGLNLILLNLKVPNQGIASFFGPVLGAVIALILVRRYFPDLI